MEKSGYFSLQLPTAAIVKETMRLGAVSKFDMPDKVEKSGAKLFTMPGYDIPLVEGCAAWMIFKILSEPHNQNQYDLFIGECVAAWSDTRVFSNGHWHFETAPAPLSPQHYFRAQAKLFCLRSFTPGRMKSRSLLPSQRLATRWGP